MMMMIMMKMTMMLPALVSLFFVLFQKEGFVNICSDSLAVYPAISTFAVQICYTNKFLLYSY